MDSCTYNNRLQAQLGQRDADQEVPGAYVISTLILRYTREIPEIDLDTGSKPSDSST